MVRTISQTSQPLHKSQFIQIWVHFCTVKVFENIRTLYTPTGTSPVKGRAMRNIRVIEDAVVAVNDQGFLTFVGPGTEWKMNPLSKEGHELVNAMGLVMLPGFVDSHTHT